MGVTGFPAARHTWELLEHLVNADQVRLRRWPIARALLIGGTGPPVWIVLPEHLPPEALEPLLLEEIGHLLLGSAEPLHVVAGCPPRGRARLLRQWDARDEAAVRAWVLAWRLPVELLDCADDHDLSARSGCTLAEISARRRLLW